MHQLPLKLLYSLSDSPMRLATLFLTGQLPWSHWLWHLPVTKEGFREVQTTRRDQSSNLWNPYLWAKQYAKLCWDIFLCCWFFKTKQETNTLSKITDLMKTEDQRNAYLRWIKETSHCPVKDTQPSHVKSIQLLAVHRQHAVQMHGYVRIHVR